jgi:hypothetical protein
MYLPLSNAGSIRCPTSGNKKIFKKLKHFGGMSLPMSKIRRAEIIGE